jgi:hypothetical protein
MRTRSCKQSPLFAGLRSMKNIDFRADTVETTLALHNFIWSAQNYVIKKKRRVRLDSLSALLVCAERHITSPKLLSPRSRRLLSHSKFNSFRHNLGACDKTQQINCERRKAIKSQLAHRKSRWISHRFVVDSSRHLAT